jgi:hypothetical protein
MTFLSQFVRRSVHSLRVFLRPAECQIKPRIRGSRALLCGEDGSELAEMAFTLPILVGLIFGLMQVCLALYTHAYISELAREGSRYAALHGANCMSTSTSASCTVTPAQVATYVKTTTGLPNVGGGTISVDTVTANMFPDGDQISPHRVKVKVTYIFPYKIPFVTSSNLTMSSTSVMTILQ